jgi:hypothetical protein
MQAKFAVPPENIWYSELESFYIILSSKFAVYWELGTSFARAKVENTIPTPANRILGMWR